MGSSVQKGGGSPGTKKVHQESDSNSQTPHAKETIDTEHDGGTTPPEPRQRMDSSNKEEQPLTPPPSRPNR
ncbi:hypothetical protein C922_05858 [Plasmodium inui San Antonio 1]|uniref:Uncharacterized protein n=1 Tax=Plasmodium inui San Antonio 1 TaxID=1237626 RepID=W7AER5_9APIC|nr:hypothetical protein C922_05858 [Plasmodium inui San Antonio 1]EUD62206.1 hypothetical protein C922_05858 [Plasmodium inui San Antonio 1]